MICQSMLVKIMLPLATEIYYKSQNTMFYVVSGLLVPAFGSSWIFCRREQNKVRKLRQNLFKRNGGLILENMPSRERKLQLFTAEDLKRATNNYDENQILRTEQHVGIIFKGILPDHDTTIVTIRKFDAPDECNLEVFISKLVTLSQINHRNIVRVIGCCLETQAPLLVCEFISAKTLYDYIHDDGLARSLTWDVRLKIAAETAGALLYMHSAAAEGPVIHDHLNSSSILLHQDYTVKLDNIALNGSEDCTLPVYTDEIGYMAPEDIGVVLVELLTGKSVFQPKDIDDFVSLPGEDDLFRILDCRLVAEGKIEQLTAIEELAQRCLSDLPADRPTMREIVITLDNVVSWNSSSTPISSNSRQEITARGVVRRNRSFQL